LEISKFYKNGARSVNAKSKIFIGNFEFWIDNQILNLWQKSVSKYINSGGTTKTKSNCNKLNTKFIVFAILKNCAWKLKF